MRRDRLIAARKAAGTTQEDIAEAVGVDRTTVGTWERGERTPHPHQRSPYAEALGITLQELDAMLSSMPQDLDDIPEWLSTYLGMEQSADELRVHEPRAVCGLLQTTGYTEHLVGRGVGIDGASPAYVKRTIDQRRHRQKRIHEGDLVLDVIQTEGSLHLQAGDRATMADQLAHMVKLAELPNVTIRVSPFSLGQYEALRLNNFVIMTHPWGQPRAYVEWYGGGKFIHDNDEVSYFTAAYEHAARIALSPKESLTWLRKQADHWRQDP